MKTQEQRIRELEIKVAYLESRVLGQGEVETKQDLEVGGIINKTKPLEKQEKQVTPQPTVMPEYRPPKPQKELRESMVGKYIIGALASILIFIAAVSLVALVWGSLTDFMRLGIIVLSGVLLTVIGFNGVLKNKSPIFSILLGTGAGLLFISILSANMFFHFISSPTAMMLAGLWVIFFILSYRYTQVFFTTIIAYLGSLIAVAQGLSMVNGNIDYVVLMVFVTAISSVLLVTTKKWTSEKQHDISIVMTIISYAALMFYGVSMGVDVVTSGKLFYSLILGVLYLLANYLYIRNDSTNKTPLYLVMSILVTFLTTGHLSLCFRPDQIPMVCGVFILISLGQIVISEVKLRYVTKTLTLYNVIILMFVLPILHYDLFRFATGLVSIAIMLEIIHYFKRTNVYTKWMGVIVLLDVILLSIQVSTMPKVWIGVLYGIFQVCLLVYLMYKSFRQKDNPIIVWLKPIGVIVFLLVGISITGLLTRDLAVYSAVGDNVERSYMEEVLKYMISSIVILGLMVVGYFKYWLHPKFMWFTRNEEVRHDRNIVLFYIVTTVLYLFGVNFVGSLGIWYEQLGLIIALLLITLLQASNLIKNYKDNDIVGLVVGLEYLVVVWAILGGVFNIETESVIMSVTGLIVSLASISLGFKMKIKSLRLYGLILTILMVLKFILVDLSQENSITRVIALLVGGIICFGISVIYNKLNTKIE